MTTCILKRVLPFVLTFSLGAALGGFVDLLTRLRVRGKEAGLVYRLSGSDFGRRHRLPADYKPPVILFKPDAFYRPDPDAKHGPRNQRVRVTFGADGRVSGVVLPRRLTEDLEGAVERAARQIQFTPATLGGEAVAVEQEVEIYLRARD